MSELISCEALQTLLATSNPIILDCRADLTDRTKSRQLYEEGHIPGALFAHLEEDLSSEIIPGETGRHPLPDPTRFEETLQNWGMTSESEVIVYDQANSMFAVRAWWLLKWAGIDNVRVLNGGLAAWQLNGGEITTSVSTNPKRSNFSLSPRQDWIIEADALGQLPSDTRLLDARALPRYRGDEEPLDAKAGHIPGAINADFSKNLNADGSFKSKEALFERFQTTPDTATVCYCGSGVTACHNILAIVEAGLPMPRLYPGSWSEWITDEANPIAVGSEGEI